MSELDYVFSVDLSANVAPDERLRVETLYQAFKARLKAELVVKNPALVTYIDGQRINGSPLIDLQVDTKGG